MLRKMKSPGRPLGQRVTFSTEAPPPPPPPLEHKSKAEVERPPPPLLVSPQGTEGMFIWPPGIPSPHRAVHSHSFIPQMAFEHLPSIRYYFITADMSVNKRNRAPVLMGLHSWMGGMINR